MSSVSSSPRSQLLRQLLLKHDAILSNFDSTFALQRSEALESARKSLERRFPNQKISSEHPELRDLLRYLDSEYVEKRDALEKRLEEDKAEKLRRLEQSQSADNQASSDAEAEENPLNDEMEAEDMEFQRAAEAIRSSLQYQTSKRKEEKSVKDSSSVISKRQKSIIQSAIQVFEKSNEDFESRCRKLRELLLEYESLRSSERGRAKSIAVAINSARPSSAPPRSSQKRSNSAPRTGKTKSKKKSKEASNKQKKSKKAAPKPDWNDRFVVGDRSVSRPASAVNTQIRTIDALKQKAAAHKADKSHAPESYPSSRSHAALPRPQSSHSPSSHHYEQPTQAFLRQELSELIAHLDQIHNVHEHDKQNKAKLLAAQRERQSAIREREREASAQQSENENEELSAAIRMFYHKRKEVEKMAELLKPTVGKRKPKSKGMEYQETLHKLSQVHLKRPSSGKKVKKSKSKSSSHVKFSPEKPETIELEDVQHRQIEQDEFDESDQQPADQEFEMEMERELDREEEANQSDETDEVSQVLRDQMIEERQRENMRAAMEEFHTIVEALETPHRNRDREEERERFSKSESKPRGNAADAAFSPASI